MKLVHPFQHASGRRKTALRTTFNTERGYTVAGQIIHVKAIQTEDWDEFEGAMHTVLFIDESRGIDGKFNLYLNQSDTERDLAAILLVAYDNGGYEGLTAAEHLNFNDVEQRA